MRATRREMLIGSATLGLAGQALAKAPADPWLRAAAIARTVRAPVFPKRTFSIVEHGARGDGRTIATDAFARAIAACVAAGGGRVLVPAGRYLTGAIRLKSNVELHLADGATILFSTDPAHYPHVLTRWEGVEMIGLSPLIYAYGETNVAVTGKGLLDGQAGPDAWWNWSGAERYGWKAGTPNQRAPRMQLMQMAESGVPVEKRIFGADSRLRPVMLQTYACRNVLIDGIRIRNAPFWNIHPVLCRNVIVRGVDVYGHGPNNDGCDPESVDMMLIENCTFNTGDDCIAIKSGRNADGRRLATPSQNILVRDCMMKDGHGGITIGSEISGGCRWVFGERNRMDSPDLWYAFRFKNNAMRGGLLEHFFFRDTEIGQVGRAVVTADFNYEEGAKGPFKPVLRDVVIERVKVAQAGQVLDLQGLVSDSVSDVTLRDCQFNGVARPDVVRNTQRLKMENVAVNGTPAKSG